MVDAPKVSVEQFLDADIDDLEDLPQFGCWPTGGYTVRVSDFDLEKEVNDAKHYLGFTFTLVEVHEVIDMEEGEETPKVGDTEEILFNYSNLFGQGEWKAVAQVFKSRFGKLPTRELCRAADGATLLLVQKRVYGKTDKKIDKDKKYPKIKQLAFV